MNYKEINSAILEGRDINKKLVKKNEAFYKYLFNNKVAYYYASKLSKNKTKKEKWIIKKGDRLNKKYIKTLEYIKDVCSKNNIEFILFKTHKIIPEVVDGDIDLIVHRKDFRKFLNIFSKLGFISVEDEPGKGKCIKKGFNIIEPHITISWRGNSYFNEKELWKYVKKISINDKQYLISDFDIETFVIIAEMLYVPEYIDLYTMHKINIKSDLLGVLPYTDSVIKFIIKIQNNHAVTYPVFAPFYLILISSLNEVNSLRGVWSYLQRLIYYVYWRIRYKIIKKLPFTHEWI